METNTQRIDRTFGSKLAAERQRRRELMRKQNKTMNDYEAECKDNHNEEDRRKGNELALEYCDQLNEEIDESLNRSLAMCAQTSKVGSDTCKQLHHQTEQIRNIHKDLHHTDQSLKDSERSIQTIQSWKKGLNWFRKPRKKQEYHGMDVDAKTKGRKQSKDKKKRKDAKQRENEKKYGHKEDADDEKTGNKIATSKARKMQQQEKMKEIDNYLDDMLEMTEAMEQEMDTQREMIEQVQDEMEDLDMKFVQKNRKVRDILHK